jgi:hypothetical protein
MHKSVEERFFEKIRKTDGCWWWKAGRTGGGYGVFYPTYNRQVGAHRFSWMLHNKQNIPEGLEILHSCDNRPCVNPLHLRLGTAADNRKDMLERGRDNPVKGEAIPNSKLTSVDVIELRRRYKSGERISDLTIGHPYIGRGTIYNAIAGVTWAHLPGAVGKLGKRSRGNRRKKCVRGHLFSDDNIQIVSGTRRCRICYKEKSRIYSRQTRARHREAYLQKARELRASNRLLGISSRGTLLLRGRRVGPTPGSCSRSRRRRSPLVDCRSEFADHRSTRRSY